MLKEPRFRFTTVKQPGTFKFTLKITELNTDQPIKKRKTKKEKRRIRKMYRHQEEEVTEKHDEDKAVRPSFRQAPSSGSFRK